MRTLLGLRRNKALCSGIIVFSQLSFILSSLVLPTPAHSQSVLNPPGQMLSLSESFTPAHLWGMSVHPENPLMFDFLVEQGDSNFSDAALQKESLKLTKYFLAALTIPDDDQWVNLSPYEKNRIIPDALGRTEMGRELLAQDYLLKQLTASLIYPEKDLGKKFWDRVRQKTNTDIDLSTFNKIWIVPSKAVVVEKDNSALVTECYLKVMLEEDVVARTNSVIANPEGVKQSPEQIASSPLAPRNDNMTQTIREIILPEIEKEVNTGKNFASLRQVYHSMILATWYKRALKESLLAQVYAGKAKTKGVETLDKEAKQKIYNQYLEAFKKGAYNIIKEEVDPATDEIVPRKYFSGGAVGVKDLKTLSGNNAAGRNAIEVTNRRHKDGASSSLFTIALGDVGKSPAIDPNEVRGSLVSSSAVVLRNDAQQVMLTAEEGSFAVEFGTNGARAQMYKADDKGVRMGEGPYTTRYVSRVGGAIGQVSLGQLAAGKLKLKDETKGLRVLVAYDARKGALEFAQAAYQAVSAFEGISVDMADGITTSPDAAFMSKQYDVVIQITASHNPENDNGIKVFTDGIVATDQFAALIQNQANSPEGKTSYSIVPFDAAKANYVSAFQLSSDRKLKAFPQLLQMAAAYRRGHPDALMLVDMMGGAAAPYAPQFEALGMKVVGKEPMSERQYTNKKGTIYSPNPTLADNYGPEFDDFKANAPDGSIFFGLDGDVDRLVVWVKDQGEMKESKPNDLGMLFLDNLLAKLQKSGSLEGKTLVVGKTLPTTLGLDLIAKKYGIQIFTVPVGSKNFRSLLENPNYIVVVATEESGHQVVTVGGQTFFDDAVTQLYQVLQMVGESLKNPAQLSAELRGEIGFSLEFSNTAVKLGDAAMDVFLKKMRENPQEMITTIEAKIGAKAEKIYVVATDNSVQEFTVGMALKPEQGLYFLFRDSQLGALAWVYFRKSGTEPTMRIYRESDGKNDLLLQLGKEALGVASSAATEPGEQSAIDEAGDASVASSAAAERMDDIAAELAARVISLGPEAPREFDRLQSYLMTSVMGQIQNDDEFRLAIGDSTPVRKAMQKAFDRFASDPDFGGDNSSMAFSHILGMAYANMDTASSALEAKTADQLATALSRLGPDAFKHYAQARTDLLAQPADNNIKYRLIILNGMTTENAAVRTAVMTAFTAFTEESGEDAFRNFPTVLGLVDKQMRASSASTTAGSQVGGINLNPKLLDMQIKRDDRGVPLPLLQQPPENLLKIEGFVPFVIQVLPAAQFPLLSQAKETKPAQLSLAR